MGNPAAQRLALKPPSFGLFLRRKGRNNRMVFGDYSQFCCATRRSEVVEELDIGGVVLLPLIGNIVLVVDRFYWAHRFACATVNALIGVNVKRTLALVDAVNGTLLNTRAVFNVNTRLSNDVCHTSPFATSPCPSTLAVYPKYRTLQPQEAK